METFNSNALLFSATFFSERRTPPSYIPTQSPSTFEPLFLPLAGVSVDFPSEPLAALEDSGEMAFILTSTKRSEIEYEVAVRSQQSSGSAAPATGTYRHASNG